MEELPSKLSRSAALLWAKSDRNNPDNWLPLYQHMADSGEVARLIWHEWLAEDVRQAIARHAGGEQAGEALVVWLAAVHDLGKATPAFQFKVENLANRVSDTGLPVPGAVHHPPYHSTMSHALLRRWLVEEQGWASPIANTYAVVPGGHHGSPPNSPVDIERLTEIAKPEEGLGGSVWKPVQQELAAFAAQLAGVDEYLPLWQTKPLPSTLQMNITGIVIMADWIASNPELCPLFPPAEKLTAAQRAAAAWQALQLPSAWHAVSDLVADPTQFLHERFPALPNQATARPTQTAMLTVANALVSPGLVILEAPMGAGKTEAALLAAEIMASRFGAGGAAFLLPTMATSNAMFRRAKNWLQTVPDAYGNNQQSMALVHGKAALNPEYAQLKFWAAADGRQFAYAMVGEDDEPLEIIVAHTWLTGRKRTLLSSFVVGTVDHLLMAVLKARHVVLRHLGLAGKVVIVDEVHAYDAYMSVYLDRALEWLGANGVPVILLSATLPPSRRQAMLESYARGIADVSGTPPNRRQKGVPFPAAPRIAGGPRQGDPSYPLVSSCDKDGIHYFPAEDDTRRLTVDLIPLPDDDQTLIETLRTRLADGGCVGIIRDIVRRAQETYDLLQEADLGAKIVLNHAQFIACDRMNRDAELLALLGQDAVQRPERLIVVGTQVLEQSLDIDFDLLITDLAPVDLLLQRVGRLHRHARWDEAGRPESLRQPVCFVTGVTDWQAVPPVIDSGVAAVYEERALLSRTLAILGWGGVENAATLGSARKVALPDDIAPLVEAVYENTVPVPAGWGAEWEEADTKLLKLTQEKESRARSFLLERPRPLGESVVGLLYGLVPDADDDNRQGQAKVRDADDTLEVVVVWRDSDGTVRLLPWVHEADEQQNVDDPTLSVAASKLVDMKDQPGLVLDTQLVPDAKAARLAATCTVRLPRAMSSYPGVIDAVLRVLEQQGYFDSWQASPWLRGELPLVLDENLTARIQIPGKAGNSGSVFTLSYDRERGLQCEKEAAL